MGRRPQPERRAQLLRACTDDVLKNGLSGATLTRLAAAADTSPRMLIYHFTTRDRLVVEALRQARLRQRTIYEDVLKPDPATPYATVLAAAWPVMTAPESRPYLRLFGELHDLPAEQSPWAEFRTLSILDWIPTIEAGLVADNFPDAAALASALVATARGLLSDLQTTGDDTRTSAAWTALVALLEDRPGLIRTGA